MIIKEILYDCILSIIRALSQLFYETRRSIKKLLNIGNNIRHVDGIRINVIQSLFRKSLSPLCSKPYRIIKFNVNCIWEIFSQIIEIVNLYKLANPQKV